jgi:polyhydroxyalkanoate synthesis regulator phasin
MAAGVIQWMVSTGCIRKEDGENFVSDLLESVQSHMSNKGSVAIQMHTEKYVVLSYLLFAYENSNMAKHMTAYIMQYLEPDVNKKLYHFK